MTNEIRKGSIVRKTKETDICIEVSLDGKGNADIDTGIGFFDHMLTALSVHSKISMSVHVKGICTLTVITLSRTPESLSELLLDRLLAISRVSSATEQLTFLWTKALQWQALT